ncbi:MAG: response regulator [Alphaproteobacteria bacterium]|nr:response regulator [Alphaproteobacteria bacterium]
MSHALYHLLVVDDDTRLRGLLERYLCDHGYLVTTAENAGAAWDLLEKETYDLMILDIMMPGESGLSLMSRLRVSPAHPMKNIPIVLLTALDAPEDRVSGLEKGADDYLTKPFEPKELLIRLERVLERRTHKVAESAWVSLGDYHFDLVTRTLTKGDEVIYLTSAEQRLLEILAQSPREELSRDELAERAGVPLSPRTVDVQVTRLRRKIETDPKQPQYLRTVRHKGYALWPSAKG